MKVSRSTYRPHRLRKGGRGGAAIVAVAVLLAGGGLFAYLDQKKDDRPCGEQPAATSRAEGSSRPPAPDVTPAAAPMEASGLPSRAALGAPAFTTRFDEALMRGAFHEAASALAEIGGSVDAERRLAASMDAARAQVEARFHEVSATHGARAAKLYVERKLEEFPGESAARAALRALIATPEPVAQAVAAAAHPTAPAPAPASAAAPPQEKPRQDADPAVGGDLRAMRDDARRVLEGGEIKAALSVLRELVVAAEGRNDKEVLQDARRMIRQGESELRLRAVIIERVAAKAAGDRPVQHLPGERGPVLDATEEGVTFGSTKGEIKLKWKVLPLHSLTGLVGVLDLPAGSLVDAAVVLYRGDHASEADALLVRASQSDDAAVKQALDQALADARGMSVPEGGFRLLGDKWLSPNEYARQAVTEEIAKATKALASPDAAVRRDAFTKMVALGDAARSPLQRALMLRRIELREDIEKTPPYAKLAGIAKQREELDAARAAALELIEDEKKYPYPYEPPAASMETYATYQATQKLVDERTSKLRTLWNKPQPVAVPKAFRDKAALLAEVSGFLREISAAPADLIPGWILYLPEGDLTLHNIATSEADRQRIDASAEIMRTNGTRVPKATKGEVDQVRVTNEYRVMFGRAAVMIHPLLTQAAHGHCDDMARLGFFAHESPVPGKTSPWDRIAATGMKSIGASENIAQASGPTQAHNRWCRSPGHHRNLLAAGWTLLGAGNVGHLWCQNFAAGERQDDVTGGAPPDDDEDSRGRD